MLSSLTVKNIALVEEITIDFEEGFNVLSGETGAGKSIIIGALSFLLGDKSSADIIRKGADDASVAGTFIVKNAEALKWLSDAGIDIEENSVLVRRILKQSGRSSAWINGTPVTRNDLVEFTSFLVDIHGQHDHQSLFKVSEHRRFLDTFAGLEAEVVEYSTFYNELNEKIKTFDKLQTSETKRRERLDYLSYAVDEIDKANLKPNEEEELEAEAKKLNSFEKLFENLQEAVGLCSGNTGVLVNLKKTLHNMEIACGIDSGLNSISQRISNQYYELEDACNELVLHFQNLSFDENRRDEIQQRLSVIYKLKKKYAETGEDSITGVLSFKKNAESELMDLKHSVENASKIEKELKALQAEIFKRGQSISQKRTTAAKELEVKIETVLKNLGMQKTSFNVNVKKKGVEGNKQKADSFGFDDVEFLISPNLGEPLKPLVKIASGGEISRVMLALKTVLAKGDGVDTLIFDEIDSGIGGEIALSVAEHIKKLSSLKQILCVTHLAVIAAHANEQIKIEKTTTNGKTFTHAKKVFGEKRIEEVARMLSGDEASNVSLLHAKELLEKHCNNKF